MANLLPSEIIYDVLSRLPVKSLLRFRCVCKSWRSLISTNPQFVKTHLHRAITDANNGGCQRVLLTSNPYFKSIDFEARDNNLSSSSSTMLDFLTRAFEQYEHEIVVSVSLSGSCNGLMYILVGTDTIIVCNPCTRKFRELPKPSFSPGDFLAHGFGYDSSVDDYKVVRAVGSLSSRTSVNTQMKIFSLRSNYWKRVENIDSSIRLDGGLGTFLDGSIHWFASCRESDRQIVSFKLATEEFCEVVPLPPDLGDWNCLTVLGGCLSVVCGHGLNKIGIWMMKEYGVEASWTKLFIYQEHRFYVVPLCLSKNNEVLLNVDNKKLMMYNLEKMTGRDLDAQGDWEYFDSATYIETLVSPNGNQA